MNQTKDKKPHTHTVLLCDFRYSQGKRLIYLITNSIPIRVNFALGELKSQLNKFSESLALFSCVRISIICIDSFTLNFTPDISIIAVLQGLYICWS